MDITPLTLTLVGGVCVVLGLLAGLLLNTLSEDNEPAAGVDEAPPGGRKGRYTPVVRLWRERGSGTLVVEMDGKSMLAPDPLNEVQRERLEKSVRDLRAWLGMGLAAAPGTASAERSRADSPMTEEQFASPTALPEQDEIDLSRAIGGAPPAASRPAVSSKPSAASQPSAPAQRMPTPARVPTPPPAQSAPKGKEEVPGAPQPAQARSIVMQIEDILQDMIAGTPLEQRGIHLMEDPTRGVIVQVGIKTYEGIDSVPDPEVKQVIQAAVQEWEKGQ